MPEGFISFERKVLRCEDYFDSFQPKETRGGEDAPFLKSEYWSNLTTQLCTFEVKNYGKIEDSGSGFLQVDFANKFLGGGSLGGGCVQEEIRFMTSPELIVGMLICPQLQDFEAIEIIGAECFSSYSGYASSFTFDGNYYDRTSFDSLKRRKTTIVAIDALENAEDRQYEIKFLLRELNKAFCGFRQSDKWVNVETTMEDGETVRRIEGIENSQTGVATGNWGCGVFGGDLEVKSMIQWIAASQARKKQMHYYTFGDRKARDLFQVTEHFTRQQYTAGRLWNDLLRYCKSRKDMKFYERYGFFKWLLTTERGSSICSKDNYVKPCAFNGNKTIVPKHSLGNGETRIMRNLKIIEEALLEISLCRWVTYARTRGNATLKSRTILEAQVWRQERKNHFLS